MEVYILILTLLGNPDNAGQGGISMIELNSKAACESAGEAWESKVPKSRYNNSGFYLCVPKYLKG